MVYDPLTELRPDEACQSVRLIHNDLDNYLRKVLWKLIVFEMYVAAHSLIVWAKVRPSLASCSSCSYTADKELAYCIKCGTKLGNTS